MRSRARTSISLVGAGILLEAIGRAVAQAPPAKDAALEMIRRGETAPAIALLARTVREGGEGRAGDELALILGNALLSQRRDSEAIVPLERVAARGVVAPGYAHLLLSRAIVQSGEASEFPTAERYLTEWASASAGGSPVVREHAAYLLVKLRSVQRSWGETVRAAALYLGEWPKTRRADEVRWLAAEALRESSRREEALRAYEAVWYDATQSPWAKEAGKHVRELAGSGAGSPRSLRAEERYDFVKALQKVGLHESALEELDRYEGQEGASELDGALLLRASSLYALRKNVECVKVVEDLRRRFPRSPHLAAAVIQAIRALRRSDDEAGIRAWVRFLEESRAGDPTTTEALYNLGVFLGAVHKEAEAITVLERVSEVEKGNDNRDDALWKLAWFERKAGRTDEAIAHLKVLLHDLPESGFRKAALYWLARFVLPTDRALAVEQLQRLLEEFPHDYYGHQAARTLATLGIAPARIGNGRPFPSVDRLQDPGARSGDEAYALAVNLRRTGLFEFASEELARVPGAGKDPGLQFGLAELHAHAGDTWEAARVLERSFREFLQAGSRDPALVPKDFWYICYPYHYRSLIERTVRESGLQASGISPAMLAALIRAESRFLPTAVSPAGAVGLMQLVPETAAKLARERTGEAIGRAELFNPETNLRYGGLFLANRLKDFGGEREAAICSYNAGLDAVRKWWRVRPQGLAMDEFLESIPYLDTRIYVKQVLGDTLNYEWIYRTKP